MNVDPLKILWLDDERNPAEQKMIHKHKGHKAIYWVKSYREFVDWIEENGLPDHVCFDHDLAPEHYAPREFWNEKYESWAATQNWKIETGLDAFLWLISYNHLNLLPTMSCHSANTQRREKINHYIVSLKKQNNAFFGESVCTHIVSKHAK